jgi:hypothetical protein
LIPNTGKSKKVKLLKCPHCFERIAELKLDFWGYLSIESGEIMPDPSLRLKCPVCDGEIGSGVLEKANITFPILSQLGGSGSRKKASKFGRKEAQELGKICTDIAEAKEKEATE